MIALLPRSEVQNKKAGQEARPKARTQVERRGLKQERRPLGEARSKKAGQ